MGRRIDFAAIAGDVARRLYHDHEPNAALSKKDELRYGNNGSLAIYLKTGTWRDYETKEGGPLLKLIRRKVPDQNPMDWLRHEGFIPSHGGTVQREFTYTDENGTPLFQAVRIEDRITGKKPASPRPWVRRPDGNGGWIKGLGGARRVPYRLPELIGASASGATVFIAEGEPKVEAIIKLGLRATCNSGGALNWRPEFNEFLRDQDVVILPDNDDAGRNHAEDVARNLKPVAKRVRVLALPDLPKKGDVVDWLRAGGSKEELLRLTEAAADWSPTNLQPLPSTIARGRRRPTARRCRNSSSTGATCRQPQRNWPP